MAAKASSANGPLYFDLETVPDLDRLELFGLDPLPEPPRDCGVEELPHPAAALAGGIDDLKRKLLGLCPSENWVAATIDLERKGKARAGIFDVLKNARNGLANHEALRQDRAKLLATTPEYCSIVALGFACGGSEPGSFLVGRDGNEWSLLKVLWTMIAACKGSPIVGFNCLGFDLPVVFVRSAILGVQPSRIIDTKPWGGDVLDLYHCRFGGRGSSGRPGKLKDLARLYGIPVPAGDCDGSQVAELMATDPQKVAEYVRSDIHVTRELHRFYQGYFCT